MLHGARFPRVHVYLHVPFCARRCSYCDFAIAVRRDVPSAAYADAVLREWAGWQSHEIWAESPGVASVYFGGGTPSRLEPGAIARILERIAADRTVAPDAEVTLEANPDDVTRDAARGVAVRRASTEYRSARSRSIRRCSTGCTGRTPRSRSAPRSRRFGMPGFAELSLDLIFGLPAALGRDWGADLERALALRPDHLSLYGLTIEDHTPLARWTARGEVAPVDEDRYAAEFLEADAVLGRAGYEHYEVSNYSLPGRRARHNSAYWRRAPFIGIGPSAHSGWGANRRWNLREWAAYERAMAAGGSPVAGTERLDAGGRGAGGALPGAPHPGGRLRRAAAPGHRQGLDRGRLGDGVRRRRSAHPRRVAPPRRADRCAER